ncbi:RNA-binding protein Musashi homolog Rbp6 [Anthophora quadrimaculata]
MTAASFPPNFLNVGILENCAGMEAANGAIEHDFHKALVPINGSHSGSSGRSTPNGGDPAPGKLFVGGLSWQTSSEKLREYFGMFGTVTDVLIMKDPVTQAVELSVDLLERTRENHFQRILIHQTGRPPQLSTR